MRVSALITMLEIELNHFDELAEKKEKVALRLDASALEIERLKTEIAAHSISEERRKAVQFKEIALTDSEGEKYEQQNI